MMCCAHCERPLPAGPHNRQTCRGFICAGCGAIADMKLRAANDTVFEDWRADTAGRVRPAERDGD